MLPGLVLGAGFGVGSLLTAYGVLRRPGWTWSRWAERLTGQHWSWLATILIGLTHVTWIAVQAVYGFVGVVLTLLPLHPTARRYLAAPAPAAHH